MQSKVPNINNLYPVAWVTIPIVVILLILLPGLSGSFLLDDFTNLGSLQRWPDESVTKRIILFLANGESGPTGRPISMASFLINDIGWPSHPYSFKYTNLLLHLLNSLLVLWFSWRLFVLKSLSSSKSGLLAMLICLLWALHPLQASTVFYVIQRMTILATTFTLAALITYLYARQYIVHNDIRKTVYLTTLIILFGVLGVLSKENAVLIPLYILVTEYFLFSQNNKPNPAMRYWLLIFSIIPSIILVIYIARIGLISGYRTRPFTMIERLYSQAHALVDYLSLIIFPRLHGLGIFHDDFPVARDLFTSPGTFISVLFILLLPILAINFRKSLPFAAFAIFWFFSGHLLESTVVPLELYFEHRNYLAMLGILIGLVYGAFHIAERFRVHALIFLVAYSLIIFTTSIITAKLWGDVIQSATVWAEEHPDSTRARAYAREVMRLLPSDYAQQLAHQHSKYLYDNHSDSAISIVQLLDFECKTGRLTPDRVNDAIEKIAHAKFYQHFSGTLINLEILAQNKTCPDTLNDSSFSSLLEQIETAPEFNHVHPWMKHLIYKMKSRIYLKQRNLGMTIESLEKAYSYKPVIDVRLLQIRYLLSAGLYNEAQNILNKTRQSAPTLELDLQAQEISNLEVIISAQKRAAEMPENTRQPSGLD